MSLGLGKEKSNSKQSSSSTPTVPTMFAAPWGDYASRVGQLIGSPNLGAQAPTPQQNAAFGFGGSEGTKGLGTLMGYRPGQIATTDLSKYTNPWESSVVDASLNDNERAREIAINQGQAQATAQGAFGGSRHGVVDSLTNQDYLRNAGSLASNLRMAGYQNAQDMAGRDISTDLAGAGVRMNAANAQAVNQRADTGLQADLGEQLRQLMAKTNPMSPEYLQMMGSLLGQIPLDQFTGVNSFGKSSGTNIGANLSWK